MAGQYGLWDSDVKLGAIILTGGASSRMGADKAEALWLGVRAVDRVAARSAWPVEPIR